MCRRSWCHQGDIAIFAGRRCVATPNVGLLDLAARKLFFHVKIKAHQAEHENWADGNRDLVTTGMKNVPGKRLPGTFPLVAGDTVSPTQVKRRFCTPVLPDSSAVPTRGTHTSFDLPLRSKRLRSNVPMR